MKIVVRRSCRDGRTIILLTAWPFFKCFLTDLFVRRGVLSYFGDSSVVFQAFCGRGVAVGEIQMMNFNSFCFCDAR